MEDGTYDADKKKATITWKRQFDFPDNDNSVSLVGGQKFKVLLQWGTFKKGDFIDEGPPRVLGDITNDKFREFEVMVPPVPINKSKAHMVLFTSALIASLTLITTLLF